MSELSPVARHRALEALWGTPPGWGSLSAVNHSIVGRRFMVTAGIFFLIGGVLAMLIRAQLSGHDTDFLDAAAYHQVFTMHGTVMMFLFAIPMIEGFALYFLPKLLGSRDLAFPRLSSFGYWCYLFGGTMLIGALLAGAAPDAGWFMYTPLSSQPYSPGINSDVWLIGVTFVEVSAVCAAVEFMVTVLKVRTAGMSLDRMPILVWYLWVAAAMMLFGFPPLILGSVLLEVERAFGWAFFDPTRGGDPLLWQHLFWLFGHPEVYIIFLPGAGIVSTLIPVFSGRPIVGYGWIVASLIGLGFLSFGLWVHHMFTTGIPMLSLAFFSAASTLVVVPTAVQVFAWLQTLLTGQPRLTLPMLYLIGFLCVFVAGGLTGVMVAIVPFDWQAHDTHFIVAHMHYVLVGGLVFPLLAGAYYWMTHLTGRLHTEGLGHVAFWLIFVGFNVTFLPMHLTGLLGMPRRVYSYPDGIGLDTLNLVSSFGGFVMAIGFAVFIIDLVQQARYGPRAPRNPWRAGTLEWAMATPPPSYNIAAQPPVADREPLERDPSLPARLARGDGYLGVPRNGWRETLAVNMLDGRPEQVLLLPGPTWIPLVTALVTGAFFVGLLFKVYPVALVALAGVLACALVWSWRSGHREDLAPVDIGYGERAPLHSASSTGVWGMIFTLMADATFFASLVFGYLFLWAVAPNWPPPTWMQGDPALAALALGGLAIAALCASGAERANRRGRDGLRQALFLASAGAELSAAAAFALTAVWRIPDPTGHGYAAVTTALAVYAAFHALLGAVMGLYAWARGRAGYVSALRAIDTQNLTLWQGYTAAAGGLVLVLLHAPLWDAG